MKASWDIYGTITDQTQEITDVISSNTVVESLCETDVSACHYTVFKHVTLFTTTAAAIRLIAADISVYI